MASAASDWPALPLEAWRDTYATLHRVAQIVGKVRLALAPHINHWWQATFYVDARGLTTSAMPYGERVLEIRFDFLDHAIVFETSDGSVRRLPLGPRPVADYYAEILGTLRSLGRPVEIWRMPVEIPDPVPFDEDRVHASYDPEMAQRFWRILGRVARGLQEFRTGFIGKCSPVQLFWGALDLACTRFSGRRAPERPGADRIQREGYSHEVWSAGFWPGTPGASDAAFYAYAVPEPGGFSTSRVEPADARYDPTFKEFLLPYESVRRAPSPETELRRFLETTYAAGADLGKWDRGALEAAGPPRR